MIKGRARRAHEEFMKALQIQTENHALGAIELLASELAELDQLLERNNFGIGIKGDWVMRNMSYAVEMSINLKGREATLLRMLLTPLKLAEVQMVTEHGMYNGNDIPRAHKNYKRLEEIESVEKLFAAVRSNIELAVPKRALPEFKAMLWSPDDLEITAADISDKYGEVVEEGNKAGAIPYDPVKAYKLALYYQEEQGNVGAYARMPK